MSVELRVRDHFDAYADRFDAIYDDGKGPVARWVDGVWRGVVRRRLDLTLDALAPLEGKVVLDVGTGSGRYCVAYAQHGARRAVGVDFAGGMIDVARRRARELGVEDRCEFHLGRFPEAVPDARYDAVTAMGFFDYVPDAVGSLASMRALGSTLAMSFPKAREWRVPLRRARLRAAGCPLYLYTEGRVRRILSAAGIEDHDWVELDRDYLVVARV